MNQPLTPEQLSLIDAVDIAAGNYHRQYCNKPNIVVLTHEQYMLMRQPHTLQGMSVQVAFNPQGIYPRCGYCEVIIEPRSQNQVIFEKLCFGMYEFDRLQDNSYARAETRKGYDTFCRGYNHGQASGTWS